MLSSLCPCSTSSYRLCPSQAARNRLVKSDSLMPRLRPGLGSLVNCPPTPTSADRQQTSACPPTPRAADLDNPLEDGKTHAQMGVIPLVSGFLIGSVDKLFGFKTFPIVTCQKCFKCHYPRTEPLYAAGWCLVILYTVFGCLPV